VEENAALGDLDRQVVASGVWRGDLARSAFDLHSAVLPLPWTIEADYLCRDALMNNSADLLLVRRSDPARPVFHPFAAFAQDQ
jgi:hypothetical protein